MQLCTLLSIKTGGCSEDCAYCAQSVRYHTGVRAERLMNPEDVLEVARRARENGSTRFCMGAAWKGVRDGDAKFEQVLEIVRAVSQLGMEVCVTLGQLSLSEAKKLKEAGVTAYNHNIDTSEEYYPEIVSTHSYSDRLNTIRAVQQANLSVCCGGIVGMGETELGPAEDAGGIDQFRSTAGERADQLLDANAGHTPRRPTAGRNFRVGSSDCNDSNCLT